MKVIKPLQIRKLKTFSLILGVSLAVCVCMLSGLDAPEYIRCKHIGVCEFLEVCGDLTTAHKSKIIMETMSRTQSQYFLVRAHFGQPSFFVPLQGNGTVGYVHNLAFRDLLQIIDRCIHPSHELLYPVLVENGEILTPQKQASPSSGSSLSSQAFQIITTSVIRC